MASSGRTSRSRISSSSASERQATSTKRSKRPAQIATYVTDGSVARRSARSATPWPAATRIASQAVVQVAEAERVGDGDDRRTPLGRDLPDTLAHLRLGDAEVARDLQERAPAVVGELADDGAIERLQRDRAHAPIVARLGPRAGELRLLVVQAEVREDLGGAHAGERADAAVDRRARARRGRGRRARRRRG